MREKQIEEMAKAMCGNGMSNGNCAADDEPCELECVYGCCAERLYSKGYRKQEWISVDERLPDRSGKYLVATFDSRIGIGNLIDYYCDGELSFDNYKVTHWMPLPEAPKVKGESK